jgi:hypothetical protein
LTYTEIEKPFESVRVYVSLSFGCRSLIRNGVHAAAATGPTLRAASAKQTKTAVLTLPTSKATACRRWFGDREPRSVPTREPL